MVEFSTPAIFLSLIPKSHKKQASRALIWVWVGYDAPTDGSPSTWDFSEGMRVNVWSNQASFSLSCFKKVKQLLLLPLKERGTNFILLLQLRPPLSYLCDRILIEVPKVPLNVEGISPPTATRSSKELLPSLAVGFGVSLSPVLPLSIIAIDEKEDNT